MEKTILAIFDNRSDVEDVINKLHENGFNPKDISIVMKDNEEKEQIGHNTGADVAGGALSGAATGAVVGGIAGLLVGTVLPGLGGFLVAGPIGAALGLSGAAAATASGAVTGAVAGGLIGALTGLGLSRNEAEHYQTRINQGAILVAVPAGTQDVAEVTDLFNQYNAQDVKILTREESADNTEVSKTHVARANTAEDMREDYPQEYADKDTQDNIPAEVTLKHFLHNNVDYPTNRKIMLENAHDIGMDPRAVHMLTTLPSEDFDSPEEVMNTLAHQDETEYSSEDIEYPGMQTASDADAIIYKEVEIRTFKPSAGMYGAKGGEAKGSASRDDTSKKDTKRKK